MSIPNREQHARSLLKNPLLPEMFDAIRDDVRETWENEADPERREQLWFELKATNDLKDFLYGKLNDLASGDG